MFREIAGLMNRAVKGCFESQEKWDVNRELTIFAHESIEQRYDKIDIRAAYRAALRDPLVFRRTLDRIRAEEYTLLTGDSELPVSAAERRYYRKRGMEVPPLF